MVSRPRTVGALLVVLVLLAACSSGDADDTPSATVPVEETTTSTTEVDVATIPATIDEAYVNKVLAALDAVDGEATRLIVQNRNLVPEATARLRAIYDESEFRDQILVWLTDIRGGLRNIKPEPGPRKTTVAVLRSRSPSCVFAEVREDFSATAISPPPPNRAFIQLIPADPSRDRGRHNPTRWMIHSMGDTDDGSDPGDPCTG